MTWQLLDLSFAAAHWIWPAIVLCTAALLAGWWGYQRSPLPSGWRVPLVASRVIVIILLGICLLDPITRDRQPRRQANSVLLLVDESQSMPLVASGDSSSSLPQLKRTLAADAKWRANLEEWFEVHSYAFGRRLRQTEDLSQLTFAESASHMHAALASLSGRYRQRPIAALLLFTDGNATDSASLYNAAESGCPIFPVVVGHTAGRRDLAVGKVSVTQTDFETSPIAIGVPITWKGDTDQDVVVQLLTAEGKVLEEQSVLTATGERATWVRFRYRPHDSEVHFLHVCGFLGSERAAFARNESPQEATLVNNRQWVTIDRRRGPYRILYVSGRPNWEFKFLRRAAAEDAEVDLVALVRIAHREPKFSFRDRDAGESNPLFAGFDEETREEEAYDEPVLLRFGVVNESELSAGFPTTEEELFAFQGVILDDLEADFLTPNQLALLRKFVSARGGGLLHLGGEESFGAGGFATSPLAELSPVYPNRNTSLSLTSARQFRLTREGLLEPWLRVRETEIEEMQYLAKVPPIRIWNRVGDAKPGASVLATGQADDQTDVPMFCIQRFGTGRTGALLAGDLWRWSMHRRPDAPHDLPQWWRQVLRWLVSDAPRQVELTVLESTGQDGITLEAAIRNEVYQPAENASVEFELTLPRGQRHKLVAQPHPSRAGVYSSFVGYAEEGGYRVTARAVAPDGSTMGTASSGWATSLSPREFQQLSPNVQRLTEIAEASGGRMLRLEELSAWTKWLPTRQVPVMDEQVRAWWHRPWLLTCLIGLLCAEWGVRRWFGLP